MAESIYIGIPDQYNVSPSIMVAASIIELYEEKKVYLKERSNTRTQKCDYYLEMGTTDENAIFNPYCYDKLTMTDVKTEDINTAGMVWNSFGDVILGKLFPSPKLDKKNNKKGNDDSDYDAPHDYILEGVMSSVKDEFIDKLYPKYAAQTDTPNALIHEGSEINGFLRTYLENIRTQSNILDYKVLELAGVTTAYENTNSRYRYLLDIINIYLLNLISNKFKLCFTESLIEGAEFNEKGQVVILPTLICLDKQCVSKHFPTARFIAARKKTKDDIYYVLTRDTDNGEPEFLFPYNWCQTKKDIKGSELFSKVVGVPNLLTCLPNGKMIIIQGRENVATICETALNLIFKEDEEVEETSEQEISQK